MFRSSGKHIQINGRRYCQTCKIITDQTCHKIRYHDNPEQEETLIKKSYWICPICVSESEEIKVQSLPCDKARIINRLLDMQDDYAIRSMKISSRQEMLIVEISVSEAEN